MNNRQEGYSKDRSGSRVVSPKLYRERRKIRQGGGDRKGKEAGEKNGGGETVPVGNKKEIKSV